MANVYEIVTERIIKMVEEKGHLPWQRPWNVNESFPVNIERPTKSYQGINFWILLSAGFKSPFWLTSKQAKKFGGRIKYAEWKKSTLIVFWKFLDDKETEGKKIPMLRYYYVYNIEQAEGIDPKRIPVITENSKLEFDPIDECEKILSDMPMPITMVQHGKTKAYYSPWEDKIGMPDKTDFVSIEEYYSTLFHEFIHATGHETRTNRKGAFGAGFGREKYSKEELVAEIGTCFLCHTAGIENKTMDNSVAYIGAWLKKLKNDPRMIVFAASQAQKATDYILDA